MPKYALTTDIYYEPTNIEFNESYSANSVTFKNNGTTVIIIDGERMQPGVWWSVDGNENEFLYGSFNINSEPKLGMELIVKRKTYIQ